MGENILADGERKGDENNSYPRALLHRFEKQSNY